MILKRDNVERVTVSEREIAILEKKGFTVLDKEQESPQSVSNMIEPVELESMTMEALRLLAKEKALTGYSSLTKPEIVEVLKGVI